MVYETATDYLAHWEAHFDKSIPKPPWKRLWITCHGTGVKWAVLVGVAVFVLASLDCIMTRTSLLDAGPTLRFLSGIYSCTAGVYIWAFKRQEALAALRQLSWVARRIEAGAGGALGARLDLDDQETLRRAVVRASRYLRGSNIWAICVQFSIMVPVAFTGRTVNPAWPPPRTPTAWWALFTLHSFSTLFLPIAFFPMAAFTTGIVSVCSAMSLAIGSELRKARTPQQVRDAALLSSEFNKGFSMLTNLFHGFILHHLQITLLIPLFACYEMMHGQFDEFLVVLVPINVLIFIPLCFAGQAMMDASEAMSYSAYSGSWLESDRFCRILRLQVMLRSARPQQLTSQELGTVDLKLCQNTLKSWFSFLNFMINTL
ncbi:Odorant receptor 37 [Frankliniella occidentalis]|uniref:Uncharacterized protein LOC127749791 n=1 Tax=Frankliniella occidentalis TaxID=133901 RepID=A0A9C6WZR3_FRAOC|nr:uncharacterized protein LOC127749791 [Frankliniella occidentalis]KAE8744780.1 Odorant receptor 37 [Frankliniella occidentalis]